MQEQALADEGRAKRVRGIVRQTTQRIMFKNFIFSSRLLKLYIYPKIPSVTNYKTPFSLHNQFTTEAYTADIRSNKGVKHERK
jgi:hypothetical protein